MQIENNKEEVPFSYYEGLFANLNPEDAVSRLADISWDGKEFYVNLLGVNYAISHPVYAIRAVDGGKVPPLLEMYGLTPANIAENAKKAIALKK